MELREFLLYSAIMLKISTVSFRTFLPQQGLFKVEELLSIASSAARPLVAT
jgi:hypothetical protein